MKNIHSSAQNPAKFLTFEFSFQVGFDDKMNTACKQHLISTAWYISLPRDWLSHFGFLLTHRTYLIIRSS